MTWREEVAGFISCVRQIAQERGCTLALVFFHGHAFPAGVEQDRDSPWTLNCKGHTHEMIAGGTICEGVRLVVNRPLSPEENDALPDTDGHVEGCPYRRQP